MGFCPFVWQLTWRQARCSDACNDGDGVLVWLAGGDDGFTAALTDHCPPLACIDSTDRTLYHRMATPQDFTVHENGAEHMRVQIVSDAVTCPVCLTEMNDLRTRRCCYPFINCTHHGPRPITIHAMPCDRPLTATAPLPLCSPCEAEFHDPVDHCFYTQSVVCSDCGPRLERRVGGEALNSEMALQATITRLVAGDIVAVKGIGGLHLACDTGNPTAVATSWAREHRPAKPLAVILPSAAGLPADAAVPMGSPAAPIALIAKAQVSGLRDEIAPGFAEVGMTLPSSPLRHLLLQTLARLIIITSGNPSGRPPALSNAQALNDLADIADSFFLYNRDILQ